MRLKTIIITLMLLCTAVSAFAEPDFDKMLKEIDQLGSFDDTDFSCVYTFVSEKPGEETEVTQAPDVQKRRERTVCNAYPETRIPEGAGVSESR